MSHRIGVIGDLVLDATLKNKVEPFKLRLGGIAHACRALWAIESQYIVGYNAPSYIDSLAYDYLQKHGAAKISKLNNVVGAPYVFLIEEAREVGDQGYEFLLRDSISVKATGEIENIINENLESIFIISGNYNIFETINYFENTNTAISIDVANNLTDIADFDSLKIRLDTIFISTSSEIFKKYYSSNFSEFVSLFRQYTSRVVLKENRGGSRAVDFTVSDDIIYIPSQTQNISHSVGVGDVYAVMCTFLKHKHSFNEALLYSSWIAAEYAKTTFVDDFKTSVNRVMQLTPSNLLDLGGVSLPWEKRKHINIYIAAPDFTYVETSIVDKIVDSLLYHNFTPRRPVKENGQLDKNATKENKQEVYLKDVRLIHDCQILIAVLLYNDPGTLIEIGMAVSLQKPVLVLDPNNIAWNCMLTESPKLLTSNSDELIAELFNVASKL